MNIWAPLPLPPPCASDFHLYTPFLDLPLKSVGDNFLPGPANRGVLVSLFWSYRVFVLPCSQPVGEDTCSSLPLAFSSAQREIQNQKLNFFCTETPILSSWSFDLSWKCPSSLSVLVRLETINLITKDKDKYLSGHKRCLEDLHYLHSLLWTHLIMWDAIKISGWNIFLHNIFKWNCIPQENYKSTFIYPEKTCREYLF